MPKPSKKPYIQALRGPQRLPPVAPPPRLSPALFSKLVTALKDARPIKTSEHFAYKDAQHRECVTRIAVALACYRGRRVNEEDYIENFMNQVRED